MRILQLLKNSFARLAEVRVTTSIMEANAQSGGHRGGGGRGRGRGGFGRGGRGNSRGGSRGGRKPEMGRKEYKSVEILNLPIHLV